MSNENLPELTEEMCNGLLECTADELADHEEWVHSTSVPFTFHWEDADDSVKICHWDDNWEAFIAQRAALIDAEGRNRHLPWNLYKSLGLNWLDGYNFIQRIGNCAGHSHKNAGKTSSLSNAMRSGRQPREIALCVTYGIARGNGTMRMGSGLNLNPMSRWAATVGNFWTSDFGRYNGGRNVGQWRNPTFRQHALRTQSIIVPLPAPSFDFVYRACAAGFGINMGTHIFPTSARVNSDNLAVPRDWRRGNHAMAFLASHKGVTTGRPYVYLENSHGARYVADSLHQGNQHGLHIDEEAFRQMASNNPFRFGTWYVNLMEMG